MNAVRARHIAFTCIYRVGLAMLLLPFKSFEVTGYKLTLKRGRDKKQIT